MIRTYNADDFVSQYRQIRARYEKSYAHAVSFLRNKLSGKPEENVFQELLEAHVRMYVVNAFLNALNWGLDKDPKDGLPNLIPEAAVRSEQTGTIKFMDYFGVQNSDGDPLLILETKRPSARLPGQSSVEPANTYAELISRELKGNGTNTEWKQYLEQLGGYVKSVQARSTAIPKRVVITNGDWLVLFVDPADAFLETGSKNASEIMVYDGPDAIVENAGSLFEWLDYGKVLNKVESITPSQLAFNNQCKSVNAVIRGLRLRYHEQPSIYRQNPVIWVAPVIFLRTHFGSWIRVENLDNDYQLPHANQDLANHLHQVKHASDLLLADIEARLKFKLPCLTLIEHYDGADFGSLPGVRANVTVDEYLIVTGDRSHYLLEEPTVPQCPYHDWSETERQRCASEPAIMRRATDPRSFFVSEEPHFCAHRAVVEMKRTPLDAENRGLCGSRSSPNGHAFCEIWRFEQHLCCRTCVYQDVCAKSEAFILPCKTTVS